MTNVVRGAFLVLTSFTLGIYIANSLPPVVLNQLSDILVMLLIISAVGAVCLQGWAAWCDRQPARAHQANTVYRVPAHGTAPPGLTVEQIVEGIKDIRGRTRIDAIRSYLPNMPYPLTEQQVLDLLEHLDGSEGLELLEMLASRLDRAATWRRVIKKFQYFDQEKASKIIFPATSR